MKSSEESIEISETDEKSPLNTGFFLSRRKFSALYRQDTNDYFEDHLDYLDDDINDDMNLKFLYKVIPSISFTHNIVSAYFCHRPLRESRFFKDFFKNVSLKT